MYFKITYFFISMISIVLGLIYSDNIYLVSHKTAIKGTTTWGKISLILGFIFLILIILDILITESKLLTIILVINIIGIAIIQIIPIIFWTILGDKVATYPTLNKSIPYFMYYIPHLLLIISSAFNSINLLKTLSTYKY